MKVAVVIPNWNGADMIGECLTSLDKQTYKHDVVVVDNGSVDNSVELIESKFPSVTVLKNAKNLGFAGGVNTGIRHALGSYDAIALFNNDAIAAPNWLESLVTAMKANANIGICTGKLLSDDGSKIDSTGDIYTTWGLPFPRGRDEPVSDKYDDDNWVFGASGGASLYKTVLFKDVGLFDEDFFAYYEDVDISFRAQLAGWKVYFEPKALVYHSTSSTGSKIKGFFTYQTIKNYLFLFWKNVPVRLIPIMLPRFCLAYGLFTLKGLMTPHRTWFTIKGLVVSLALMPKKLIQRRTIMKKRAVSDQYIKSILTWDLPPNANALRSLRAKWRIITGRI